MDKGRVKDLATLMPWVGLFLFTPPVLFLFRPDTTIFGVPVLPVYLFVMWFVLILISRKLTEHQINEPGALRGPPQSDPSRSASTSRDEA